MMSPDSLTIRTFLRRNCTTVLVWIGIVLYLFLCCVTYVFVFLFNCIYFFLRRKLNHVRTKTEKIGYLYAKTLLGEKTKTCNIFSTFQSVHCQRSDTKEIVTLNMGFTKYSSKSSVISKPIIVYLHGVNSTSLQEITCVAPALTPFFDIYAVDLVGFGRSSGPSFLLSMDVISMIDFIVDSIHALLKKLKIDNAVIMGHSLGGYIATTLCKKYPEVASRLVLVAPAGLFSTGSDRGAYYGFLFAMEVPMGITSVLYRCGPFIEWVMQIRTKNLTKQMEKKGTRKLMEAYKSHLGVHYNTLLSSEIDCIGGAIVRRLIDIDVFGSKWTIPNLKHLLTLHIPVDFIYGQTDDVTPYHQGIFVTELLNEKLNNRSTVQIVRDAWHNPFTKNQGKDLVEALERILHFRNASCAKKKETVDKCVSTTMIDTNMLNMSSTFDREETNEIIRKQYSMIRQQLSPSKCG